MRRGAVPELFDVLLGQRAYRELLPDPVPDELVERVLDAAVHAPSAENRQPWVFVVVRDEATRRSIGALTAQAWERGGRAYSRDRLTPGMFGEVDAWATGGLAAAPVHVVVCGDSAITDEHLLPSSVYPAVQNLLLAAIGVGLGSLLSTLPLVMGSAFRDLLDLPDRVVPLALVPIGYPARPLGRPRRTPAVERTFRDRYGRRWT